MPQKISSVNIENNTIRIENLSANTVNALMFTANTAANGTTGISPFLFLGT